MNEDEIYYDDADDEWLASDDSFWDWVPDWDTVTDWGSDAWDYVSDIDLDLNSDTAKFVKSLLKDDQGNYDVGKIAGTVSGVASLAGMLGLIDSDASDDRPVGYQGKIPEYTAVRSRVDTSTGEEQRRPGSGGRRYFSDVTYATPENAASARTATDAQAETLRQRNLDNVFRELGITPAAEEPAPTLETAGATALVDNTLPSIADRTGPVGAEIMAESEARMAEIQNNLNNAYNPSKPEPRVVRAPEARSTGTEMDDGDRFYGFTTPDNLLQTYEYDPTANPFGPDDRPNPNYVPRPKEPELEPEPKNAGPFGLGNLPNFSGGTPAPTKVKPEPVTGVGDSFEYTPEQKEQLQRDMARRYGYGPPSNSRSGSPFKAGGIARLQGGGISGQAPITPAAPMSRQDLVRLYETNPREAFRMVMSGEVGGKPQSLSYARTYLEQLKKAQAAGQLPSQQQPTQPTAPMGAGMAQGGIASMAPKGYYLGGTTDGMADKVPATIDQQQPAALSDGEFVIPADVVSHLGNGNSNAGAKQLYGMMDRIRQARTGTTEQGKQVNPNKFMPV